jgi:ribA/ribD-fused uncharacterized protein
MIDDFHGQYRYLSNFWPCKITYEGVEYPTSEHAYQAAKSLVHTTRLAVASCSSPGEAKRYGRNFKIRPDWEEKKFDIMVTILREKFKHPDLAKQLKKTGNLPLIEGNTWHDNIWGNCKCIKCRKVKGQNLLGKALMLIRNELQKWEET